MGLLKKRWFAPLLLALLTLAPFHRLLVGAELPVPDDGFISDLADGEFPVRVEAGRLLRAGEAPLWTSRIWTGVSLCGSGAIDPLSLLLYTSLPPALALGWHVALLLAAAALGAFALARQIGASRPGAFLAGFVFAWSGFFVCQLRHLGVLGTVAFFPAALFCLERAACGSHHAASDARMVSWRSRVAWLVAFAGVFGLQILEAFPQSAYISGLCYAALVSARGVWLYAAGKDVESHGVRVRAAGGLALGALGAAIVGLMIGAVQLLPLHDLGSFSDRGSSGSYEWATHFNYWPPDVLTFFIPYINGDISDLSYQGTGIFWEDYGYVGLLTVSLAILAALRMTTRFAVAFWSATTILTFGLVLGRYTPLFRMAHDILPGLSTFRFPTRFLFVVELGLALLGALGLTLVENRLAGRWHGPRSHWLAFCLTGLLVAVTVVDVVWHNRRQNPFADAARWMAAPRTAKAILAEAVPGRVFSPSVTQLHMQAFVAARGWSDLEPFYAHREYLQPNGNLLHGVSTVDGYSGISPWWLVNLLGDHNRNGVMQPLYSLQPSGLQASPAFFALLEALSVRWMILPRRVDNPHLRFVLATPEAALHELQGTLPRARVMTRVRVVGPATNVARELLEGTIDLRREVLVEDPAVATRMPGGEAHGVARIVLDRSDEVVVDASAPRGGLLLLADTWYPGWEAAVDGRPESILRANLAHRAVPLPPGDHRVVFRFQPASFSLGLALSGLGVALLLGALIYARRRTAYLK
ncbi:MAG: YfhO family protein [Deltaproteobacteria bacterium]|nr:YfhO family protein [Deltaproteobacteria bacterium]